MRTAPLKFQPSPAAGIDARSKGKPAPTNLATSLTLAAMSLGYGVVQLDVTIVNTALNSIGTSLGGGVAELQWVVSAYTIAFAAFILTAGALGDRIGAKRVFMAGFAIFTAASVACALASNATVLTRQEASRDWVRRSWFRTRWRCSATPIPTKSSAAARSEFGLPAPALRLQRGRSLAAF
jgi:DHA2 family methylenomycin A resistance protein-like MFS transporter